MGKRRCWCRRNLAVRVLCREKRIKIARTLTDGPPEGDDDGRGATRRCENCITRNSFPFFAFFLSAFSPRGRPFVAQLFSSGTIRSPTPLSPPDMFYRCRHVCVCTSVCARVPLFSRPGEYYSVSRPKANAHLLTSCRRHCVEHREYLYCYTSICCYALVGCLPEIRVFVIRLATHSDHTLVDFSCFDHMYWFYNMFFISLEKI